LGPTPAWTVLSAQRMSTLGWVSGAGDLDGDGYDDVIVGAYSYDNDQLNEGRVFAYRGSPGGLATTPVWTAQRDQTNSFFGVAVGGGGDVSGGGRADGMVGAGLFSRGQTQGGRAFVYLGAADHRLRG